MELVDKPAWLWDSKIYLEPNLFRIRDWNIISQKDKGVDVKFCGFF
jgi:hypothetical protein